MTPTPERPLPGREPRSDREMPSTPPLAPPGPLRWLWFALGASALGLGALGAILPLLPTTPFILVAVYAFSRSSPALGRRIEASRTFGPLVARWREHGAIAPRIKFVSVGMMAAAFALSIVLAAPPFVLVIQGVLITVGALFVLSRPSGPR